MDPRDELFAQIHVRHLKPAGFRKAARASKRLSKDGLSHTVLLESGPRVPFDPLRFDIELRASHSSLPANRVLINIGLCSYTEGKQRWTIGAEDTEEFSRVLNTFQTMGTRLLERMGSIEGLITLYEEIDVAWYFRGHAWCLDMLGKHEQANRVVMMAIERAPHEEFRKHAIIYLREREALAGA